MKRYDVKGKVGPSGESLRPQKKGIRNEKHGIRSEKHGARNEKGTNRERKMKKNLRKGLSVAGILLLLLAGCGEQTPAEQMENTGTESMMETETPAESGNMGQESEDKTMTTEQFQERFQGIDLAPVLKKVTDHNPVMTQRFGADPYALVYDGRVYLYMTGDTPSYNPDKTVKENTYGNIKTINVISSADLVNWTDHGTIYAASKTGAATWGANSWAPAAAYKNIDGKDYIIRRFKIKAFL